MLQKHIFVSPFKQTIIIHVNLETFSIDMVIGVCSSTCLGGIGETPQAHLQRSTDTPA